MLEFEGSKIYYFQKIDDNPIYGRGEPLRLLFDDTDMDFEYIRYKYDEWPAVKQKLILEGHRMPTLPFLITKEGKFYGTSVPLIRFICKKLNKYIPKLTEDEYLADAYSDLYNDWMSKWAEIWLNSDPKVKEHYETTYCDTQLDNWHNILGDRDGPYVFGDKISYTDFLLYQLLNHYNGAQIDTNKYPRFDKFVKIIQSRPSLKKHFENEKKEFSEL
ncbi:glutathione S-transferase [Mucor ambiguus]|uniref:Glutathione S-transferase n=1 Tax=Mucor ambiguus TaxID=91626 RepID=A0A0C9LWQ9_9FUNG|nr:glutathione S-transferase [Mucor ambiguus]